uniref:Uncharacterized protein n=1 Tax=Glossina pallidipes TaxID=7398 RepID=A0A1B0A6Z2_GLOPL
MYAWCVVSKGTRYAIAKGTELNAVEKKQPQAVATFITSTTAMAVMRLRSPPDNTFLSSPEPIRVLAEPIKPFWKLKLSNFTHTMKFMCSATIVFLSPSHVLIDDSLTWRNVHKYIEEELRRGKLRSELLRFEAILEGPSSCWLIPPLPSPPPPPPPPPLLFALPLCVPKEDISYSSPKDFCNNFSNRITRVIL